MILFQLTATDTLFKVCLIKLFVSVNSFVKLVPHLLESGAQFVLSDEFNQDPLEQHFGCQQIKVGCNENPMLNDYMHNELKLQVAKANMVKIKKGNTRGRNDNETLIDITDTTPLPKRQKK